MAAAGMLPGTSSRNLRLPLKIGLALIAVVTGVMAYSTLVQWRCCRIESSREAATKGNASAIRSSLAIYAAEHGGQYPFHLGSRPFVERYLDGIPKVQLPHLGHPGSTAVETYAFLDSLGRIDPVKLKDTGHWLYDSKSGTLTVDCTHKCFFRSSKYAYQEFGGDITTTAK